MVFSATPGRQLDNAVPSRVHAAMFSPSNIPHAGAVASDRCRDASQKTPCTSIGDGIAARIASGFNSCRLMERCTTSMDMIAFIQSLRDLGNAQPVLARSAVSTAGLGRSRGAVVARSAARATGAVRGGDRAAAAPKAIQRRRRSRGCQPR